MITGIFFIRDGLYLRLTKVILVSTWELLLLIMVVLVSYIFV